MLSMADLKACFNRTTKNADLFHSTAYVKWFGCWTIINNGTFCVFVNDPIMLSRLGGHPIPLSIWNSSSLLTKSKTIIRSIKMYIGFLCSLHFSCNCLREKIMLIIDLCALNPHWDSGYILSTRTCSLFWTVLMRIFPLTLSKEIPW